MTATPDADKAAEAKAAKEAAKAAKEAKDKANAFDPEEYKKDNIKPLDDLDVAFLKSYVRTDRVSPMHPLLPRHPCLDLRLLTQTLPPTHRASGLTRTPSRISRRTLRT
jgi:hypothetical protein